MKLIYCEQCGDLFQLRVGLMRQCECGAIKGQYVDVSNAEVSENAVSVAIGNGAFDHAVAAMKLMKQATHNEADRDDYKRATQIQYAWVRPNTGPGNPHTKTIK